MTRNCAENMGHGRNQAAGNPRAVHDGCNHRRREKPGDDRAIWEKRLGRSREKRLRSERGAALVLVLWVLVLLTVIVGSFSHAMRTEVNMTRNFNGASQAYYLARAGVQLAIYSLLVRQQNYSAEGVWRINTDIPEFAYGPGAIKIRLDNESGRINLNNADTGILEAVADSFGLNRHQTDVIIDSILDWRDEDEMHRLNGAESDYYQSLAPPYRSKDAEFDTVEELLFIKGVTPEIYFGGLRDMVTVLPTVTGELQRRRSIFRRRQVRALQPRININAASPALLAALPGMSPDLVQKITDYRREKDFEDLIELQEVVGPEVYNGIIPYITLELSPLYRVRAVGLLPSGPVRQGIEALVRIDPQLPKGYQIIEWKDGLY